MKKKICMVVPSFSAKGGITSVVSGYRGSQLEQDYEVKYIETYCDGNKLEKALIVVKAYFSYLFTLLFWHPSIIHIHSSFGGSFYRKLPFIVLGSWFHKPIINHIHGSYYDEFYFNASKKKKQLISKTFNRCACIIALSENAKKELSKITQSKIEVVENYGIINDDAVLQRKNKENKYNVLFLGFVTKKKGCFDIPDICSIVKGSIPEIRFTLCGVGDVEDLNSHISDKLCFEFPGWIGGKEKDSRLREADLFFLPSYSEGMPMSILEAMGYGLPIIATNVGGVTKIVKNGQNGFVYEPGDKKGMADGIVRLLADDLLRKQFSEESIKILNEKYSRTIHLEKIFEMYQELL